MVFRLITLVLATGMALASVSLHRFAFAAVPNGNDWFEFHANPFTGGDDTGDGGSGAPSDLNYYYVGQSFNAMLAINSLGTTVSNVWVDYDTDIMTVSNLTTGAYFNSWGGQNISDGRVKSTGYNFPLSQSGGEGEFGTVEIQLLKPFAASYGMGSPAVLDINIGQVGESTESNIALDGVDLLDDAEDFQFHIWADTRKPYAKTPQPGNGAVDVPVDSLFSFELRDSLNGEGDDSGVGIGVNIDSASADITADDGSGPVSLKTFASYTCSGIWGSNLCAVTVDPLPATPFSGDSRRWEYGTTYSIEVSGYEDLASSNQDQLGDTNGPNVMNATVFTFTTEPDIVKPQLRNIMPADGTEDIPLNTTLSFDVIDRQAYPDGMSGSGMKAGTCRADVSSPSFTLKTYKSGDAEVTTTTMDYGRHFNIDPVEDFSSNETVTVRIYDCEDNAGNTIDEQTVTFKTVVPDSDLDGVLDSFDNCPDIPNADQADSDLDGIGDVCDESFDLDSDGDTITDDIDNCVDIVNTDQADQDEDGIGDVCDDDIDGDTVSNDTDNCVLTENADQADFDEDGIGDVCDDDIDGDTVSNDTDNCVLTENADQADLDEDGIGDVCDDDIDGDDVLNDDDNCRLIPNPDQSDLDEDGIGDPCDLDVDIVRFNIKAKPEKRVVIGNNLNLTMIGDLSFYNQNTGSILWKEGIALSDSGLLENYTTEELTVGSYDIALKGESHLSKIVRNVAIGLNPAPINLDYTFDDTFELIAGDVYPDDRINSFDLTTLLLSYRSSGVDPSDLNKDGHVNAPDIGLIILNYMKAGEEF